MFFSLVTVVYRWYKLCAQDVPQHKICVHLNNLTSKNSPVGGIEGHKIRIWYAINLFHKL